MIGRGFRREVEIKKNVKRILRENECRGEIEEKEEEREVEDGSGEVIMGFRR